MTIAYNIISIPCLGTRALLGKQAQRANTEAIPNDTNEVVGQITWLNYDCEKVQLFSSLILHDFLGSSPMNFFTEF